MSNLLTRILANKRDDVARAKAERPLQELIRKIKDTPKPRSFKTALTTPDFGIIAEIKKKSPSRADMNPVNVQDAPEAYRDCKIVKAVSILTDWAFFGMTVTDLQNLKGIVQKPVLRKDFIFDEYQVYEARAFGADAILLMACLPVSRRQLRTLFDLASELGMDVLCEVHSVAELRRAPDKATIYGVNSRQFQTSEGSVRYRASRILGSFSRFWSAPARADLSTDLSVFERLIRELPKGCVKVAESGLSPSRIQDIRSLGFDSALIGTSLLQDSSGVRHALNEFAHALGQAQAEQTDAGTAALPATA